MELLGEMRIMNYILIWSHSNYDDIQAQGLRSLWLRYRSINKTGWTLKMIKFLII